MPLPSKLFKQLPLITKLCVDYSNNLILDEVILNQSKLKSYVRALQEHNISPISIIYGLISLQQRKQAWHARSLWLANGQFHKIANNGELYANDLAQQIINFANNIPNPTSFSHRNELYG